MIGSIESLLRGILKIRQKSYSFVVIFMLAAGLSVSAHANDPQKFLIVESYPWAFYENNRVKGASVEWLEEISATNKLALTPVVTSFQRGLEMIKRGEIDFIIAPNASRFQELGKPVFPVLAVPMVLVARPGLTVPTTDKLMGLNTLGMISGLRIDEIDIPPVQLPPMEEMQADSALRRMAAGKLDALIVSKFALMAEAKRQDLPVQRWPQRPFGTVNLALFLGAKTPDHPQTEAVLRAVRQGRDARSFMPYLARYLGP